jgi:hypothetical protein
MTSQLMVALGWWIAACTTLAAAPLDLGGRLEPLVDDFLIERLSGASLKLNSPIPREVAIVHDEPWEGNVSAYHTVFQDGDLYRMYYRGAHGNAAKNEYSPEATCYAESKDGVRWSKPKLGLFEFRGSKANNIVWLGPGTQSFAPFRDPSPGCPADERYKAVGPTEDSGKLLAFKSADGIHWSRLRAEPIIGRGTFDSLNTVFWDGAARRYVLFERHWRDSRRGIATATSSDFLHWTEPVYLEYPGAADEELYTNGIVPYERAQHILLGFPLRYVAGRNMTAVQGFPAKWRQAAPGADNAVSDALFMTSRDGVHFHRWGEALIRPGLQADRWLTRNNCVARGIVHTRSEFPEAPPELSLYSTEGVWRPDSSRLRRFTVRMDGFVSVHADSSGGQMLTRLLTFAGESLAINFSTSAAGSVRVEIQSPDGTPIPGFAVEDCPEMFGDQIAQTVSWKPGRDLSKLAGRPVRLRFVLRDADLYAIQFR